MVGAVIAASLPPQAILQLFTGLMTHSSAAGNDFIAGMSRLFLIASGMSAVGTIASLVRGRESVEGPQEEQEHVFSES